MDSRGIVRGMWVVVASLLVLTLLATVSPGQVVRVETAGDLDDVLAGRSGRLVLFLIRPDARLGRRARPIDFFFPHDPQPLFARDVPGDELLAGPVELDGQTPGFDGRRSATLSGLPPGNYRAQAAWIHTRGDVGDFQLVAGNLVSEPETVRLEPGRTAVLRLTRRTEDRKFPSHVAGVEEFVIRSERLSQHYNRDFYLRVGVRPPRQLRPQAAYPAVFEVPGFGGDHGQVAWLAAGDHPGGDAAPQLADHAFYFVLAPSSPNGHTLFLDSENNGPWTQALIHELLPALQARYPLRSEPQARVLRGHSSGGWTVLHLALHFPDLFGAAWATAPDPVAFEHFQRINLYRHANAYRLPDGTETPSVRSASGTVTMTVRQENLLEHVLGPDLSSAQQWASWQACFGSRRPDGGIRPLFDPLTGDIDPAEAQRYRRFDLLGLTRQRPRQYVPIWKDRIRLIVGTADDFFLDEAIGALADFLASQVPPAAMPGRTPASQPATEGGYIRFVPAATHGSVLRSREARQIPAEIVAHFRRHGLWPPAP